MKIVNAPRNKRTKMGRPKLPASQRRTTPITFYGTQDEKSDLQARARNSGMSLSNWLVEQFFPKK